MLDPERAHSGEKNPRRKVARPSLFARDVRLRVCSGASVGRLPIMAEGEPRRRRSEIGDWYLLKTRSLADGILWRYDVR